MTKPPLLLTILALVLPLAACHSTSPLQQRYPSARANYGDTPLPNDYVNTPPLHIVNPDPTLRGTPEIQTVITGTWTFTTPPTTTRIERKTQSLSQFSIYNGRPAPDATPLVVIDVMAGDASQWVPDAKIYTVKNKRTYILNGNEATQWTGTTTSGEPFIQLTLTKPSDPLGDHCYAIALPKTADEKALAKQILSSITWTPAAQP